MASPLAAVAGRAELAAVMRGLSAIFWGLPLALLAFARHFLTLWPNGYDLVWPSAGALVVLFGIGRMHRLHPQERVWQRAVLQAEVVALMVAGLAPFLFFWGRLPGEAFFARGVLLVVALSLAFLVSLTRMLARLAAMLPDETTAADARLFQGLALYVVTLLAGIGVAIAVRLWPVSLTEVLSLPRQPFSFGRQALLLLLTLVPVAMAMAVTWKLKEIVMALVIGPREPQGTGVGRGPAPEHGPGSAMSGRPWEGGGRGRT